MSLWSVSTGHSQSGHDLRMDDLNDLEDLATDPDCPNCSTRCRPRGAAWWCYTCNVAVILSDGGKS